MGLKREHKENLVKLNREKEVNMFKLRGEHAAIIQHQQALIIELNAEIESLKQEIERSKTIADIQVRKSQPHKLAYSQSYFPLKTKS